MDAKPALASAQEPQLHLLEDREELVHSEGSEFVVQLLEKPFSYVVEMWLEAADFSKPLELKYFIISDVRLLTPCCHARWPEPQWADLRGVDEEAPVCPACSALLPQPRGELLNPAVMIGEHLKPEDAQAAFTTAWLSWHELFGSPPLEAALSSSVIYGSLVEDLAVLKKELVLRQKPPLYPLPGVQDA